jgi:signal transduction histidine kinase
MSEGNLVSGAQSGGAHKAPLLLVVVQLGVVIPTIAGATWLVANDPDALHWQLAIWAVILALVEFLPVPAWRGMPLSVGFPILIAVGFIYPHPIAAAVTALAGSLDPREFRGEVNLLRALFNRCQIALSVFAASAVFHSVANLDSAPLILCGAAMLASAVDYITNATLVTVVASISYRTKPSTVFRELRIGSPSEFVISYLGLGLLGLVLAVFFELVGFWAVPVFLLPLLFARQMFFRSRALEEAHKELQDREQVLLALSNRMAEERQDERAQIAAFLHDDLAQLLFRLSIEVDIARRQLRSGNLDATSQSLEKIRETKNRTADRIRALIRDLHRSPLGHAGLADALRGFIEEIGKDSGVRFHTDVTESQLPPPIALLVYHIAREGVMNAMKHSGATNVYLDLHVEDDDVLLAIRDDGVGFDTDAPGPEGHFGLAMMRERAQVAGGTYSVNSARGEGTTISVRLPASWLRSEENAAAVQEDSPAAGTMLVPGASPGMPPREEPGRPASLPA